jgi:hypothetical protein
MEACEISPIVSKADVDIAISYQTLRTSYAYITSWFQADIKDYKVPAEE